jgi:hypothetical protein
MGKHALHVPLEFATATEVKSWLGKFAHFHNSVLCNQNPVCTC